MKKVTKYLYIIILSLLFNNVYGQIEQDSNLIKLYNFKIYFDNENLKSTGDIYLRGEDTLLQGGWIYYYNDSVKRVKAIGYYYWNKPDKEWCFYNKFGDTIEIQRYYKGHLVGKLTSVNGKLIEIIPTSFAYYYEKNYIGWGLLLILLVLLRTRMNLFLFDFINDTDYGLFLPFKYWNPFSEKTIMRDVYRFISVFKIWIRPHKNIQFGAFLSNFLAFVIITTLIALIISYNIMSISTFHESLPFPLTIYEL